MLHSAQLIYRSPLSALDPCTSSLNVSCHISFYPNSARYRAIFRLRTALATPQKDNRVHPACSNDSNAHSTLRICHAEGNDGETRRVKEILSLRPSQTVIVRVRWMRI